MKRFTPPKQESPHTIMFDHFQFALIHGPDIPGSYAILLFTASDLASITSHIHSWVFFLLWLHPFILSGVISPLISSSILGICLCTYQPEGTRSQLISKAKQGQAWLGLGWETTWVLIKFYPHGPHKLSTLSFPLYFCFYPLLLLSVSL